MTLLRAFLFFAVLALTSGCNGGSPIETISPSQKQSFGEVGGQTSGPNSSVLIARPHVPYNRHREDRDKAWMAPRAGSLDLLYVSDEGTNDVYVYSWPQADLVGKLTHVSYPQGECTDAAGHVFITSFAPSYGSRILKYIHAGTRPILRIQDKGYFASGCAIDPRTGNLAVTNLETTDLSFGNVAIYDRRGRLLGLYAGGGMAFYFFCGYDSAGDSIRRWGTRLQSVRGVCFCGTSCRHQCPERHYAGSGYRLSGWRAVGRFTRRHRRHEPQCNILNSAYLAVRN